MDCTRGAAELSEAKSAPSPANLGARLEVVSNICDRANPTTHQVEIVDENHYYPFGLKHTNYNVNEKEFIKEDEILQLRIALVKNAPYNYKYNGKEYQDELGLNMYDYGARNYDPALGRWMNIDPLAEESRRWSPCNYCYDNPMRFIDPDGMKPDDIIFIVRGSGGKPDRTMTYKNGSATWNDTGKKYDGKGGNSTINKTLAVYKKIENGNDKVLKNQLKTLENSKENHYIEVGAENEVKVYDPENAFVSETKAAIKDGEPMGTSTTLNFSEDTKKDFQDTEGVPETDAAIVTHEMQHQYDYDQGNMADSQGKRGASSPAEQRAVKNENRMRKAEGVPARKTYNGVKIDPKKL